MVSIWYKKNLVFQSTLWDLTISPLQLWWLRHTQLGTELHSKSLLSRCYSMPRGSGPHIHPTFPNQLPLSHCMTLSRATPSRTSKSPPLLISGEECNTGAWINSVLRQVLATTLMRMASILLDDLHGTVTERLCDAAATEDSELAGAHFACKLIDTGTWAWIFPACSAILGEGC